ncbi:MAG TPA: MFS transporter, partial [Trueperaceae bacterium]
MSAVTPAFPDMRAALGVSAGSAGWLITAYSLPGIALTPLVGILADRRGRKGTLFGSLVLYGLAGGGCALAPGFGLLLALRFLQGIGGAALFSLSVTIISDLYQGPWRARALALDAGAVGLGAAVFPAIGGSLALLGWRLPFATAFLAVPLALALLWRLDVPEPRPSGSLRGYLLDVRRHLANRTVRGNLLITVLINFVLVGAFFGYLPHVLEAGFGASALVIGVIMAMRALSFFGTSTLLDRLGWLAGPRVRVE